MDHRGYTRQEAIERGYMQRCKMIALLQSEIDIREEENVPVSAYILDEYDDAVKNAGAYAIRYGFDFDLSDYQA